MKNNEINGQEKSKTTRAEHLKSRKLLNIINWGDESLTYNEIKKLGILDVFNNPGKSIIIQDMHSENNPYYQSIKNLINRLFKQQFEAIYLLGFQRGFEEGGSAMEIEYLLNKDD